MATSQIRPDWTVGTLTLVAGSKDFTTAGSALEAAAIQGGDEIITASGHTLIIDTITGQNAGTLMENCPAGAAGAGQSLRIRFQPDGSRYNGATADLIRLLGSGNVYAFSELVGVDGGVPVFTGAGTLDIVPKAEFGPTDTKGNLAAVAALDNISNLTELASLAKANDQFVVMDADGKIAIVPIKQFTDEIAKKFQLPEGGSEQQLLSGTGGLIEPASLPISTDTQDALNLTTALVDTKSSYNWIINGDFTINQRDGVKKPANGVYGFDRWKGHANGIEQIVEALPAGEYTLTWSGGGNGTFGGQTKASPIKVTVAGGNTSVVVPQTASKVSLVQGDATSKDPWEVRSAGLERLLCGRYFKRIHNVAFDPMDSVSGTLNRKACLTFDVHFRVNPTITYQPWEEMSEVLINYNSTTTVTITGRVFQSGNWGGLITLSGDAEFY